VRRLGAVVASSVDLDRIVALARSAPDLPVPEWSPEDALAPAGGGTRDVAKVRDSPEATTGPVIAVAGGQTFGYSYPETAELLAATGAEVAPFDPLRDEMLPDGTCGLVFGGGFPELYADELSANELLCRAVSDLAIGGAPVVAESTGLVWLVKECDGRPMCGVLNASATTTGSSVLGYRESVARASSPLVPLGATVTGHKSHRTVVTPRCGDNAAWQWRGAPPEGFVWRQVHASYLNLHWAGHPEIAKRFVAAARRP
jgi:cobyrinic acid a,c-diamide synthase